MTASIAQDRFAKSEDRCFWCRPTTDSSASSASSMKIASWIDSYLGTHRRGRAAARPSTLCAPRRPQQLESEHLLVNEVHQARSACRLGTRARSARPADTSRMSASSPLCNSGASHLTRKSLQRDGQCWQCSAHGDNWAIAAHLSQGNEPVAAMRACIPRARCNAAFVFSCVHRAARIPRRLSTNESLTPLSSGRSLGCSFCSPSADAASALAVKTPQGRCDSLWRAPGPRCASPRSASSARRSDFAGLEPRRVPPA